MTTQDLLEKELSRLEAPAAPDDLLSRCLATVPAKRPFFAAGSRFVSRFALTAAVAIAGAGLILPGTLRTIRSVNARRAFARSLDLTKQAPFWQSTSRYLDTKRRIRPELAPPPKPVEPQRWHISQDWFDRDRGCLSVSHWNDGLPKDGHDTGAVTTLYLPSGLEYMRFGKDMRHLDGRPYGDNRLIVTHNRADDWQEIRSNLADRAFEISGLTGDAMEPVSQTTMTPGTWKGRPAMVFTLVTRDTSMLIDNRQRQLIYTDSKSGRILARQVYQVYTALANDPSVAENLILETEYTYERPAASLFTPEPLRADASSVQDQWPIENGSGYVDKNGVLVGVTEKWLVDHPDKFVGMTVR